MTYIIQFKEEGEWKKTSYTTKDTVSHKFLIDFFGLNECEDFIIEEDDETLPFTDRDIFLTKERRFWAAALILSGKAANYHNSIISNYDIEDSIRNADLLLKTLLEKPIKVAE